MLKPIIRGANRLGKTVRHITSKRSDGDLIDNLHPYRQLMPYVMRGRNESVVYYDDPILAESLLAYVDRAREVGLEIGLTHCLVAAASQAIAENPRMNQFIAGRRLYARKNKTVTFSMKRKKMNKEAKLAAVKMEFDDPNESFRSMVGRINGNITVERSDKKTFADKELGLFSLLPRPALELLAGTLRALDHINMMPASMIKNDGFYTSIFIANLGSLGMNAGFHHLYEYGTCPLFLMVGKVEERAVVIDGEVVVRKILPLRYSYDERIEDGLTSKYGMASVKARLEDPVKYFGEL